MDSRDETVLTFAGIIGECIARAYLSEKKQEPRPARVSGSFDGKQTGMVGDGENTEGGAMPQTESGPPTLS